jgi:hypothetical protein
MIQIDDNLAFDIGAYTGDTVPMIKSLGYTEIVCFEPEPNSFKLLKDAFGNDEKITCIQKALSNKNGKSIMTVNPRLPILNTLEENWLKDCRHEVHCDGLYKIEIETITMDSFIESINRIPHYVKLDAEGHGDKVLEGLNYKPAILSFEWVSEFDEINISCIRSMHRLGFKEFTICSHEEVPNNNHSTYDFENVIKKMIDIKRNDLHNNMWGNIWSK